MTAKDYLARYRWITKSIEAKRAMASKLREQARTVGGVNSVGTRSSQPYDRVGEITAKIVDLEREINEEIARSIAAGREIRAVIADIPDERGRVLFELYYLNCLSLEQAAEKLNLSYRHVRRLHKKYLSFCENVLECPLEPVL